MADTAFRNLPQLARRQLLAAVSLGAAGLPVLAQSSGTAPDDALAAAVAATHRSAANRARDRWRHPLETLRFFGLNASQSVVEIAPGAGWYTEILAPWLRDRGRLVAAHYSQSDPSEYRRRS
ncbi:MAG: hypothetical protein EBT33_16030, partial [Betaproteobacteria bacterium]|nr:hypothetical protein [Betaproteobacteria bacterium]